LVAFWHGLCGLPICDGGIERIGFLRVGSHSPTGYNPGVEGPQMSETTGLGLPSPHTVIRNIRSEAELWRAAGLFKADLALVDRWRIGE
jgi:hypothetical protein